MAVAHSLVALFRDNITRMIPVIRDDDIVRLVLDHPRNFTNAHFRCNTKEQMNFADSLDTVDLFLNVTLLPGCCCNKYKTHDHLIRSAMTAWLLIHIYNYVF